MRIDSNGVALNVEVSGEGTPVLLLHGFPDSHRLWRHQVPALNAAGFRTIVPDLRGFGASDKPVGTEAYGVGEHMGDLGAILDALELPSVHVVGHDWGAAIAWMVGMFMPERVDRLVTVSVGKPGHERTPGDLLRFWYMFAFQSDAVLDYLTRDDFKWFRACFGSSPDIDEYVERYREEGALLAAISIYRSSGNPDLLMARPMDLPPVKADTMGIWSDGDFALTEEQMVRSEGGVEGSWRYEKVPGVGHWIPIEAPDRVSELLIDFLS